MPWQFAHFQCDRRCASKWFLISLWSRALLAISGRTGMIILIQITALSVSVICGLLIANRPVQCHICNVFNVFLLHYFDTIYIFQCMLLSDCLQNAHNINWVPNSLFSKSVKVVEPLVRFPNPLALWQLGNRTIQPLARKKLPHE